MKIGTTDIKEIFLGTTEVKKIFSGTSQVWTNQVWASGLEWLIMSTYGSGVPSKVEVFTINPKTYVKDLIVGKNYQNLSVPDIVGDYMFYWLNAGRLYVSNIVTGASIYDVSGSLYGTVGGVIYDYPNNYIYYIGANDSSGWIKKYTMSTLSEVASGYISDANFDEQEYYNGFRFLYHDSSYLYAVGNDSRQRVYKIAKSNLSISLQKTGYDYLNSNQEYNSFVLGSYLYVYNYNNFHRVTLSNFTTTTIGDRTKFPTSIKLVYTNNVDRVVFSIYNGGTNITTYRIFSGTDLNTATYVDINISGRIKEGEGNKISADKKFLYAVVEPTYGNAYYRLYKYDVTTTTKVFDAQIFDLSNGYGFTCYIHAT